MARVIVRSGPGLRQDIQAGAHVLRADEPVAAGGTDAGPDPYALLLAALGACTSMTLRLYAARKGWDLREVVVELDIGRAYAEDCAHCEDPRAMVEQITRRLTLARRSRRRRNGRGWPRSRRSARCTRRSRRACA